MRKRFLHLADVHLGYLQYGKEKRYNDFTHAFESAINYALDQRVDFVVLAGDLFNRQNVDPRTLDAAYFNLGKLRDAGIPVVAVEGNHEMVRYHQGVSWLQFLCWQGLVHLIDVEFENGEPKLEPWNAEEQRGAYVDLDGVRVYGLRYYGAATRNLLPKLADAIAALPGPRPEYSICLMHAGLKDHMPEAAGGLEVADFESLRWHVDYLALGHVHKPYEVAHWLHNPGSLETWSIEESAWPHGFYDVQVDVSPEKSPPHTAVHVPTATLRRCARLHLDVDRLLSPQALYERVDEFLAAHSELDGADAVVEFVLAGDLAFDRQALDLAELERRVQETLHPLVSLVKNHTGSTQYEVKPRAGGGRAELERQALRGLLERDARYAPHAADWAELALELKNLALEIAPPETIVEHLNRVSAEIAAAADAAPSAGIYPDDCTSAVVQVRPE